MVRPGEPIGSLGRENPSLAVRVRPSPALLDHAVGEAAVYVQGASL